MANEIEQPIDQGPTQAEVTRERQRFLNLVEKIDKLEKSVDAFEEEHDTIDDNVAWLEKLKNMRNEIEQAHETFESSINEKCSEYQTKVEQLGRSYNQFIDEKKEETQTRFDEIVEIRVEIDAASEEIQKQKDCINAITSECENGKTKIDANQAKISKILSDAEKALSSATSAGLAREFERQKDALKKKEVRWVIALVVALVLALGLAYYRLTALQALMASDKPITGFIFLLNCLISLAAIGAPVWFAWLATKQIGYCFRLSEDYAFKAATAGSFEGFRQEIESLSLTDENESNDELRLKLLTTVLTRLDEQPLRYVDSKVHGSPFHEALLGKLLGKIKEDKTE